MQTQVEEEESRSDYLCAIPSPPPQFQPFFQPVECVPLSGAGRETSGGERRVCQPTRAVFLSRLLFIDSKKIL